MKHDTTAPDPGRPSASDVPDANPFAPPAPTAPVTPSTPAPGITPTPDPNANPFAPPAAQGPGPAVPVPPRQPNPWRTLVLVLVGVLVAGAALGVHSLMNEARGTDNATYRLTVPHTLLSVGLALRYNHSAQADARIVRRSGVGFSGLHGYEGTYDGTYEGQRTELVFIGYQGHIDEPVFTQQAWADTLTHDDASTFLVRPASYTPPDDSAPMDCAVIRIKHFTDRGPQAVPVCVWADHSTIGIVYDNAIDPVPATTAELNTYVTEAALVRDDVRVKTSS